MSMNEVYEVVGRSNKRGVSLTPETRFIDDMGLDSLAVMELVTDIEDQFDVNMPLDRLPEIQTIGDLAAAVEKLRGGGNA